MNAEKTGQYIRQRRTELGMTQQDLADRLFISAPAISKWENGKSLPDIAILEKLAEVLDTSVEAIMSSEQLVKEIIDLSDQKIRKSKRRTFVVAMGIALMLFLSVAGFFIYQLGIKTHTAEAGLLVSLSVEDEIITITAKSQNEPLVDIKMNQTGPTAVVEVYRTVLPLFYKDRIMVKQFNLTEKINEIQINRNTVWKNGLIISSYAQNVFEYYANGSNDSFSRSMLLSSLSRDYGAKLLEDNGSEISLRIINDPSEQFIIDYTDVLFALFDEVDVIRINNKIFNRENSNITTVDKTDVYAIQMLLNDHGFDNCDIDSFVTD